MVKGTGSVRVLLCPLSPRVDTGGAPAGAQFPSTPCAPPPASPGSPNGPLPSSLFDHPSLCAIIS
eukprot:scaffold5640_cov30-Tisochrysis_lutea.AAC.3